jgi:hypothetical protein
MNKLGLFLVFLVGATMGIAAAEANVAAPMAKAPDSAQFAGGKMCPQMAAQGCCAQQGPWAGRGWNGMMARQGFGPMFQNGQGCRANGACGMRPHFMVMGHRLIHAAILAFLLLNILLTVLVSLDMAKRAKFNGLWIPILLVAGMPGSAVYALFRLGDIVAEAKKN